MILNDNSEIILSLESSTPRGSLCLLCRGKQTLIHLDQPQSHARELLPLIEQSFNENSIWYEDLTALYVTVGPGSFSGIRIGLSVARTIAFTQRHLRLQTFTTLECVAAGYIGPKTPLMVAVPAGKGEIYAQTFEQQDGLWCATSEIVLCSPDVARPMAEGRTIIGHGRALLMPNNTEGDHPQAHFLLAAPSRLRLSNPPAKPLYIRAPDAKLPTKSPI